MRVAHFAKYAFVRIGGVERHVGMLTRGLAARGVDVTVFVYDPSGSAVAGIVDGVRVEPVRTLAQLSSQPLAPALITRSRRLARARPFDVVHQHWPDPFAHLVASLMPDRPAQVVSWHCDIVRQRAWGSLYLALASRTLALPDAVVGATESHLRSPQVARFAPPGRQHVIPYGVAIGQFEPTPRLLREAVALRAKYGDTPLVFALGRHVYYKGFEVLIRAMSRVPAVLLLGGDGPLTPQLRQLAAELDVPVTFVGTIPDKELPVYYYACDAFCLPSTAHTEAFGLVQADAMACGKPVVNTALGNGVNELAPHDLCALTVVPGDESALAGALCRILRDSALASRLGSAGRARVRSGFTVEAMLEKTISLYEALIRDRGRSKTQLSGVPRDGSGWP